jgi:hypothetical protein
MGYETRVSQAVSLVESGRQATINEMKRKLSRCDTWTSEQHCQLSDRFIFKAKHT